MVGITHRASEHGGVVVITRAPLGHGRVVKSVVDGGVWRRHTAILFLGDLLRGI
jgi:hypothetical protein